MRKIPKLLLLLIIFGFILLLVGYLHALFFRVNVVFYSAIFDAIIASGLTTLLFLLKPFNLFQNFEKILVVFVFILLGYSYAISVPTVIDRSLSFYILEKLQQRGGELPYADFDNVFKEEYMIEHHLVDVRLTEQVESGTVEINDNIVVLTKWGDRLASFSRFYRKNLLPKKRLLMGTYSDVLTDPFK